jgi:hypothetical protein
MFGKTVVSVMLFPASQRHGKGFCKIAAVLFEGKHACSLFIHSEGFKRMRLMKWQKKLLSLWTKWHYN